MSRARMAHTPHVAQVTDVAQRTSHTSAGLKARWLQAFLGYRLQDVSTYVVGVVLSNSADWQGTCIYPVAKLAKAAGYAGLTIRKQRNRLVSFGMIELVSQGGKGTADTSVYRLCEPSQWWRSPYLSLSIGQVPPHDHPIH